MTIEQRARIRFTKKVTAIRAKKDGSRRKEYFQKGQEIVVPRASALFRVERGEADFLGLEDVNIPDKLETVTPDVDALRALKDTTFDNETEEIQDPADILKNTMGSIEFMDLDTARKSFSGLTMEVFDTFVESSEIDFDTDSRLVIGSAIEEFQETGDFATIDMRDFTDAIKSILSRLGK